MIYLKMAERGRFLSGVHGLMHMLIKAFFNLHEKSVDSRGGTVVTNPGSSAIFR